MINLFNKQAGAVFVAYGRLDPKWMWSKTGAAQKK